MAGAFCFSRIGPTQKIIFWRFFMFRRRFLADWGAVAAALLCGLVLVACDITLDDLMPDGDGKGNGGDGGSLTINGLPSGGNREVYVFSPGTDLSSYEAITAVHTGGTYQAVGTQDAGGNTFTLYNLTQSGGFQGDGFTGEGNLPVLLINYGGSATNTANPMYAWTVLSFSKGTATAAFSAFTPVIDRGGASFSIDFSNFGPVIDGIRLNGGFQLSPSGPPVEIIVRYAWDYSGFKWYVDGVLREDTGTVAALTLDASGLAAGSHRLMVIAEKAGVPYSQEFSFAVVN
jgi:hypothetical protein